LKAAEPNTDIREVMRYFHSLSRREPGRLPVQQPTKWSLWSSSRLRGHLAWSTSI